MTAEKRTYRNIVVTGIGLVLFLCVAMALSGHCQTVGPAIETAAPASSDAACEPASEATASLEGESDPQTVAAPLDLMVNGEPSYEAIQIAIDNLNLGPDATVEDLRQREAIVGAIAGIQDTALRYDLLEYLENKEKEYSR